jgi:hypothetical protein
VLVKELIGKDLSNINITEAISAFILDTFAKYIGPPTGETGSTPDPAAPAAPSTPPAEPTSTEEDDVVGGDDEDNGVDIDDGDSDTEEGTENPTPGDAIEEPVTPEKIFRTYDGVSKRMAEDLTKGLSFPEMKDRLNEELKTIMKLLNMIDSISGTGK